MMGLSRALALCALCLSTSAALAEEVNYTLDTSRSSAELKVGEKGVVSIVINPGPGRKVHAEAPLTIGLKAPAGLTLSKTKLGHADVADKAAKSPEFSVEVTATAAGKQATEAQMQFFICTDKWCERMQEKLVITTVVK